jgi:signal transduction histidine kinase/CheY-like chemotaxis protein/HPt (histidine-containing phosphotransfer) domain-containing protein
MISGIVVVGALLLQLLAAFLALRLIRITGAKAAWTLVAAAILLMLARRCVMLFRILADHAAFADDPFMDWLSLGISVCMVIGVAGIGPIFQAQRRTTLALQLNEARLQALVRLNQMSGDSLQEITDFALESAVSLTGSKIGYVAFVNEDESVMTMNSWSKTAMQECAIIDKPIVYPVVNTGLWGEAIRQRRPVITNDYQASNPWKKGFPGGHVELIRHMNTPIFDGDRIVLVAGVGNKQGLYDDSDIRQLTLLMHGMWQLLKRRQDEERLRDMNDALETRVAQRTAELAEANRMLLQAKDAAEAASRAKSTFLANMSHEIRTPLNAIIGMTELVLQSEISPQQREFLATVRDSGEALLSTIKDILDFSKIEAGKLALDYSTFDLRESLGDTMKSFAVPSHHQGLELACYIHPDVPRFVSGDYSRVRQIVVNLVGNAIKFTERGEVTLEVSVDARTENAVTLHFIVADTGIGVAREKQAAIFEMFEQADPSTTRRHGGTGLGLAIVSRLVGLMHGRIWVESDLGQGSRFHFLIRLDVATTESEPPVSSEPTCLHGLRVLVVDDNATNRHILVEMLRSWQMAACAVQTATEAIRQLREATGSGKPFRLVLADAHMPHVDGFLLARQIKDDPILNSTVVMMLTSGGRSEDLRQCREIGITGYLLKPIKQSELLEALELALGIGAARPRPAEPAGWVWNRSLRILLAEDSLVNQKLAEAILQQQGHSVKVACNGCEAFAYAAAETFDLILMDVQMPDLDGLEATVKYRDWERQTGRHVPIIAVTAHALKGDRQRCLEAGMDGYITKPLRAGELCEAIAALLPGEIAERSAGTLAVSPPRLCDSVCWAGAMQGVAGNRQQLISVVEAALEEFPRLTSALGEALAKGDATVVRHTAHTLKGSLHYFGKTAAFDDAARLEQLAKDGDIVEAGSVWSALREEIPRVLQSLRSYLEESSTCHRS